MKIVIVYASNSGSNYISAQIINEILLDSGHEVKVVKAAVADVQDIKDANLVVCGSPSWDVNGKEGQPQEYMTEFLTKLSKDDIQGKNFALYGCGDKSYLHFCGAVDEMEKMIKEKGGVVAKEPLKVDSFYFDMDASTKLVSVWAQNLF